MKILVIDNYDSFVYNLVHIIRELGYGDDMDIYRNDKITLEEVDKYDKILLSPGPGIPEEAGILIDLIKKYASTKSILGVCLGHQAIAEVFGAELENMDVVLHGFGFETRVEDKKEYLFENSPQVFTAARYHSWAVNPDTMQGTDLVITAMSKDNRIMGIRHTRHDVRGVQFHPESVLTTYDDKMIGKGMIKSWLTH